MWDTLENLLDKPTVQCMDDSRTTSLEDIQGTRYYSNLGRTDWSLRYGT
jgi:hypothetical protein